MDHWLWTGSGGFWGNAEATIHESDPNFPGFGRAKRLILALMDVPPFLCHTLHVEVDMEPIGVESGQLEAISSTFER